MRYATHDMEFVVCVTDSGAPRRHAVPTKAGVLRRIVNAVRGSRQTQADRQIARFLARSGGRLTDDLERRMMQNLSTSNWSARD